MVDRRRSTLRLPCFGLLTLLIAGLVASLVFAWVGSELQIARRESQALEALKQAGAKVLLQHDADWWHRPEPSDAPLQSESTGETIARVFGRSHRPALHTVWLDTTDVEERIVRRALAAFSDLPEIERLVLTGQGVDDDALEAVAKLPNLETLELNSTHVTAEGLKRLGDRSALQELRIDEEPKDARLASAIGEFRELRRVTLSRIELRKSDVAEIASLRRLTFLQLIRTRRERGSDPYEPLREAKGLRRIVSYESFIDDDLRHVAKAEALEELTLHGIGDDGLVHLRGHERLVHLSLAFPVTDEAAREFSATTPGCVVVYEPIRRGKTYLDGRPLR